LGVDHEWLGFVDSGLPEGDPLPPLPEGCFALQPLEVAAEPLVRVVREFRPHGIPTYDENGGSPRPHPITTPAGSGGGFEAARARDRYPGTGEPWQPLKLYYHLTFHKQRVVAMHEAAVAEGLDSPFAEWLEGWEDKPGDAERLTTRVPCADYFAVRDAALI